MSEARHPEPNFSGWSRSTGSSKRIWNAGFMTICIGTACVSVIILLTLLSSILIQAVNVVQPHMDQAIDELALFVVQGENADNHPDQLDVGDLVQGVFRVAQIKYGGLDTKNDVDLGEQKRSLFGVLSFEVEHVEGENLRELVQLKPAGGQQGIAEILLVAGFDVNSLPYETNASVTPAVAWIEIQGEDVPLDRIDVNEGLLQQGKIGGIISAENGWSLQLVAGFGRDTDTFDFKKQPSANSCADIRAALSVLRHAWQADTEFLATRTIPIGGDELILGDLTVTDGTLTLGTAQLKSSGFHYGGTLGIWSNAIPEDEGVLDYVGHFLTSPPKSEPRSAGIGPALSGTIWVCLVCALIALPLGVGTAVFMEEFKPENRFLTCFHSFVQLNITNLAGVPSIVYGILGLTAFAMMFGLFGTSKDPALEIGARHYYQYLTEGYEVVFVPVADGKTPPQLEPEMIAQKNRIGGESIRLNVITADDPYPENESELKITLFSDAEGGPHSEKSWFYMRLPFGRGVLAASLTLMLVILPVIIISSQEALRSVPSSLREGALGLGSTRWQVVRRVTLPAAIPGMMTGAILSTSRAIGEAAPILILAGIIYITQGPQNLMDDYSVLPIQLFFWTGLPVERAAEINFQHVAAAGIVVLLTILLTFNALAITIRQLTQKQLS